MGDMMFVMVFKVYSRLNTMATKQFKAKRAEWLIKVFFLCGCCHLWQLGDWFSQNLIDSFNQAFK